MSWLPAIRFAGNRWWLPLSRPAADLIAAVLVEQEVSSAERVAELTFLMRCDPPLAIFAALTSCQIGLKLGESAKSMVAPETSAYGSRSLLSLGMLASELLGRLPSLFASGDAYLSLPADRNRFVSHWEELQAAFITMPPSDWLAVADQWLTVAGPPVPLAFCQRWPTLIDEIEPTIVPRCDANHFDPVKLDLSLLARKLRRAHTLGTAFGAEIRHAKKASLKQLAYGLSHEINNPLSNINARAQGLRNEENDPTKKVVLQKIMDQTMRAHEMVADLMFYAHPPSPSLGDVNLMFLLGKVADQAQSSIAGRGIEIRVVNSDQKPAICLLADRAMLAEAIRALVRNSIEAIGCDGRVELEFSSRTECGKKIAVILVRDSGPGLSDDARRHAFDPYYSGREAGRGLGVGLCRVERIATLHGGGVSLLSGPAGCTARLWMPAKP